MRANSEFRDRDDVQVAVLDALVDRAQEGMTVFELRTHAEVDIDDLETALAGLKEDGLITVEEGGGRTIIRPDDRVVPGAVGEETDDTLLDWIRDRLPL